MSSPLILSAPAKINLFLRVLKKRDDGYHDILTLMQPVTLYDDITLSVKSGEGIEVSCGNADIPTDKSNLAYRAAELFLKATGTGKKVEIQITKNIPVAAGLGGGSSDAAAVLKGLNSVSSAGLSVRQLMEIGSEIGSDVPFFLLGGPALAAGRGTELTRVELPGYQYILINPGFKVSTAWAYNNLDLTKRRQNNTLSYSKESFRDIEALSGYLANDLEAVTLREHPEILSLKSALIERGAAGALMSGSGPTVFGIFRARIEAASAFDALRRSLDRRFSIYLVNGI